MSVELQNAIVIVLLCGAAAYLARVAYQSVARRKAASCGGCDHCASGGEDKQVVGIESLTSANSLGATGVNSRESVDA